MPARTHRSRVAAPVVFVLPFLVLFAVCFVIPIGYAVYESMVGVKRSGLFGQGNSHDVFVGLSNYSQALSQDTFVHSALRVLLFAVVEVPVMIVLSTALALLLDTASARFVRLFRMAYFLPYGVPGVIASILWGFLYVPGLSPIVSILNGVGIHVDLLGGGTVLWSIANIVTWEFAGYNMLVVVAQLRTIPNELYEAARIDGATGWQTARLVKLPMVRPALTLITVFTMIGTLQLFSEPYILRPISTSIDFNYTPNFSAYNEAFNNNHYNLAAAEAVLLSVVAFVLSFGFLWLVNRRSNDA